MNNNDPYKSKELSRDSYVYYFKYFTRIVEAQQYWDKQKKIPGVEGHITRKREDLYEVFYRETKENKRKRDEKDIQKMEFDSNSWNAKEANKIDDGDDYDNYDWGSI
jgi:hypothetical protein